MPWLKTVGCDCPECGPDACSEGCVCDFSAYEAMVGSVDPTTFAYDVTGQFLIAHDISIDFSAGLPSGGSAQLEVLADSSSVYNSGCIDTNSVSATVTIPAGTLEIEAVVTSFCGTGTEINGSEFTLACV